MKKIGRTHNVQRNLKNPSWNPPGGTEIEEEHLKLKLERKMKKKSLIEIDNHSDIVKKKQQTSNIKNK